MTTGSKSLWLVALLLAITLAGLGLLAQLGELDLTAFWRSPLWLPALLVQGVLSGVLVLMWQRLVRAQLSIHLSAGEATAQVGVTVLGKYLPGKVWGLVGRVVMLRQRQVNTAAAAQVLVFEQVLILGSGLGISAILLGSLWFGAWGWGILLGWLGGVLALPVVYRRLADPVLQRLTRRLSGGTASPDPHADTSLGDPMAGYAGALTLYLIYWVLSGIALGLLVYPYLAADPLPLLALLTAALPAAVLTGFFALWAPGGIGVREGILVAILATRLPMETALFIALTYRVLCVISDLAIGALTLWYFARHPRQAPAAETP